MASKIKGGSVISLSVPINNTSNLFRPQTVSLLSNDFDSPSFQLGKIQVLNGGEIRWTCPQERKSGMLKIRNLFKEMKKGGGFLIAEEAISELPGGIELDTDSDTLLFLDSGSSSLFVQFHDWDIMDEWTNNLLALLNELECEITLPENLHDKAWVFDLTYRRVQADTIEVSLTYYNISNQFGTAKSLIRLFNTNVPEEAMNLAEKTGRAIDSIACKIIEAYLYNCLRETIAGELAKDSISIYNKQITFTHAAAIERTANCAQFFASIEKKHKAEQISEQLEALSDEVDPLLICLRLLELQKFTMQTALRKAALIIMHEKDDDREQSMIASNMIENRISELYRRREEINARMRGKVIDVQEKQRKDCSCFIF